MILSPVQAEYRAGLLAKLELGEYALEEVLACPCGSMSSIAIAERDRFGIPIGVVLCQACGLGRTTPRLAAADLGAFYEDDYHGLHHGIRVPDPSTALFRVGQGAAIHRFLADLLPPGPLRIADIGCGSGGVLRDLAFAAGDRSVTCIGCEYSEAFAAAGRQAGTDIRHGGPETLADEARFDLVILSHVVEHFPGPVRDLAALRALGHAGTLFYVEVPGLLTIDRKPEYAYRLEQYLTLAHTFHFTLDTLAATMARAGFGLLRGDEAVHAVFRQAPAAQPANDATMANRILDSIRRLDSWPLRVRRLRPQLRQIGAGTAKRLLPEAVVERIRRARVR